MQEQRVVLSMLLWYDFPAAPDIRQKGAQEDLFCWTKQWYPVAIVRDLEASKPTPVKLLGKSLVLWRDAEEQWQCFADTCPHRLAPWTQVKCCN